MRDYIRKSAIAGAAFLLLPFAQPLQGADWILRAEPRYVEVYGHDQHALTLRSRDTSAVPAVESASGIDVENPPSPNLAVSIQRMEEGSGWGFDLFYFGVTADGINRTDAGSATVEVVYEASDQVYSSTAPTDVVYYTLRGDNRLEMWTGDLYYLRTLSPGLDLQLGIRFGDFDNDYHAVIGVQGSQGTFLDAVSNYPRMMGPLVGLSGTLAQGRHRIEGYLGQSVIVGRASLNYTALHFTGTPSSPTIDDQRRFSDFVQVAIPISELRLRYSFQLTGHLGLGIGLGTSAWWDVPTPPGVAPDPNAGQTLHEDTVVLYSLLTHVEWRF